MAEPRGGRSRAAAQLRAEGKQNRLGLVVSVVMIGVGMALLALVPDTRTPDAVFGRTTQQVAGAGTFTLGILLAAMFILRMRGVTAPPPATSSLGGVPATRIPRSSTLFAFGLAFTLLIAVTLGALAWAASREGDSPVIFGLAAGVIALANPFLPVAMGRYGPGSLWLTPDAVTHRWLGIRAVVRWDDIAEVLEDPGLGIVGLGVRPGREVTTSYPAGPWRGEFRGSPTVAVIKTQAMGFGVEALTRVLRHYVDHPEARRELDTAAALESVAALAGAIPWTD